MLLAVSLLSRYKRETVIQGYFGLGPVTRERPRISSKICVFAVLKAQKNFRPRRGGASIKAGAAQDMAAAPLSNGKRKLKLLSASQSDLRVTRKYCNVSNQAHLVVSTLVQKLIEHRAKSSVVRPRLPSLWHLHHAQP